MALTVEDGTGLAAADAFVSVATADAYHSARGNSTWVSASSPADTDKEEAIRRASYYLSYAYDWKGYRLQGRSQSLAWPRSYVTDAEGWSVAADAVPQEIKDACCEIALRELVTPGSMTPDVTTSTKVKSEQVGPLKVEYLNMNTSAQASVPVLTYVTDLVSGLLADGAGSSALTAEAVRI